MSLLNGQLLLRTPKQPRPISSRWFSRIPQIPTARIPSVRFQHEHRNALAPAKLHQLFTGASLPSLGYVFSIDNSLDILHGAPGQHAAISIPPLGPTSGNIAMPCPITGSTRLKVADETTNRHPAPTWPADQGLHVRRFCHCRRGGFLLPRAAIGPKTDLAERPYRSWVPLITRRPNLISHCDQTLSAFSKGWDKSSLGGFDLADDAF